MNLKNLSLSKKIFSGFLIIAIISAIITFIDLNSAENANNAIKGLIQNRMPKVQYLVMMKEGITAVKAAQRIITIPSLAVEDRKRQYKRFDEAFERINKAKDEYNKIIKDNFEKEKWETFLSGFSTWESLHNKFVDKSKSIDLAFENRDPGVDQALVELMKITMFDLKDIFFQIEHVIDELTDYNIKLSHDETEVTFSDMSSTKLLTIILAIVSFIIAISLGIFISNNVIKNQLTI